MKTKLMNRIALLTAMAFAGALITFAPTAVRAEKGDGAAALVGKTTAATKAVPSADKATMSCTKCKDSTVTYSEEGKGAVKVTRVRSEHLCPACKTIIRTVGVGKNAIDKVIHTCMNAKDAMTACCIPNK